MVRPTQDVARIRVEKVYAGHAPFPTHIEDAEYNPNSRSAPEITTNTLIETRRIQKRPPKPHWCLTHYQFEREE